MAKIANKEELAHAVTHVARKRQPTHKRHDGAAKVEKKNGIGESPGTPRLATRA